MKSKIACVFVIALCLSGSAAQEPDKKELSKFAGAWSLKELTYDGEVHKLKFNVVFKGNEGRVEGNDSVQNEYAKIKFKIDSTANPKRMDITVAGGSQTDATMEAIYEVKDDELRICAKVFGKGRPKDFASADGSSVVLLVLTRKTP